VRRYRPIAEAVALLAVTFPLAVGLHLPTLWLVVPFAWVTFTKRSYVTYGLTLRRPGSVGFHVAVSIAVFVPYMIGHYALAHWWQGAGFRLRVPVHFGESVIEQALVIALPEEFFFRGYLQTQLDRVWQRPYTILGTPCGVGLPVAAAVFAACHVPYGGVGRLVVFFPGLLYGWLRARTDTIAVPALYHAASNLLMQIMLASLTP